MVIFITGLPGTGKTLLAKTLAERLNAIHISSDLTRKEIKKKRYSEEAKSSVYKAMKERMKECIQNENNVILDATFSKGDIRSDFFATAESMISNVFIISLTADEDTLRKRLSRKRPDSEADFEVYEILKAESEPINREHLTLDSSKLSLEEMVHKVLEYCNLS